MCAIAVKLLFATQLSREGVVIIVYRIFNANVKKERTKGMQKSFIQRWFFVNAILWMNCTCRAISMKSFWNANVKWTMNCQSYIFVITIYPSKIAERTQKKNTILKSNFVIELHSIELPLCSALQNRNPIWYVDSMLLKIIPYYLT